MKTVAIFTNGEFPVPAVNGGSVTTHIEYLLNYNEKHPTMNFIVMSMYTPEAVEKSKNYNYSRFIFINKKGLIFKLINGIRHEIGKIIRRFTGEDFERGFIVESVRLLKKKHLKLDAILIKDKLTAAKYIKKSLPGVKIFSCAEWDYLNIGLFNNKPNIVKSIFENTDTFICVSNFLKKQIDGIPTRKDYNCSVKCCYNGLQSERFRLLFSKEEKNNFRKEIGLNSEDFVILFTGRLLPVKGVLELIKAYLPLHNKAKLLILGSSDFGSFKKDAYILELLDLSAQTQNIKFTGCVNYFDIHKYYKIADICVFPSIWEEAFNLSVLEAMSSGVSVMITRSGGMPEITSEKGAIIVNRDEHLVENMTKEIESLIENPQKADEMIKIALERSDLFTNEAYAKNMLNILSE